MRVVRRCSHLLVERLQEGHTMGQSLDFGP